MVQQQTSGVAQRIESVREVPTGEEGGVVHQNLGMVTIIERVHVNAIDAQGIEAGVNGGLDHAGIGCGALAPLQPLLQEMQGVVKVHEPLPLPLQLQYHWNDVRPPRVEVSAVELESHRDVAAAVSTG